MRTLYLQTQGSVTEMYTLTSVPEVPCPSCGAVWPQTAKQKIWLHVTENSDCRL